VQFIVKGLRDAHDVVEFSCEATDESEAALEASSRGLRVLSIRRTRLVSLRIPTRAGERFPLILFSQELISLLDAGLPIVEALEALAEKGRGVAAGTLLDQVLRYLREGRNFSDAIEQHPEIFPALFVSTVRASEKTGDMKEALQRYVDYQSQVEKVRRQFVSSAIYPLLLLGVGTLVTLFLMLYVVPKFSRIYEDIGGDLPLLSRLLMNWGTFLGAHTATVIAALALASAAVIYTVRQSAFRRMVMQRLWTLPVVGQRIRVYELSRFYRTLGMLLRSGIPMVQALEMAGGLLPPELRALLGRAAARIRQGQPVSSSLLAESLTTPVSLRLLRVGERSGGMGKMVEKTAQFLEDETIRWVDWATRLFEPLLMAAIGIVIGVVVLLLYMPIFELAASIQ
jgi:general secretion pathway protein F